MLEAIFLDWSGCRIGIEKMQQNATKVTKGGCIIGKEKMQQNGTNCNKSDKRWMYYSIAVRLISRKVSGFLI